MIIPLTPKRLAEILSLLKSDAEIEFSLVCLNCGQDLRFQEVEIQQIFDPINCKTVVKISRKMD